MLWHGLQSEGEQQNYYAAQPQRTMAGATVQSRRKFDLIALRYRTLRATAESMGRVSALLPAMLASETLMSICDRLQPHHNPILIACRPKVGLSLSAVLIETSNFQQISTFALPRPGGYQRVRGACLGLVE